MGLDFDLLEELQEAAAARAEGAVDGGGDVFERGGSGTAL